MLQNPFFFNFLLNTDKTCYDKIMHAVDLFYPQFREYESHNVDTNIFMKNDTY